MDYRAGLLRGACALAVISACATGVAHAQGSTSSGGSITTLEDVVVTARKREESLQTVPVAVTSVTGGQLEQQGIRQTTDLDRFVPSLSVDPAPDFGTAAVFTLRGQTPGPILITFSQPVGVYEDGVNVPHPDGLAGAFFDVARVEVLKGPQGTLYGRNTTGGAVNIITRNADYQGVHGFVTGEVGNHKNWRAGGAVNVPIVDDVLTARVAYNHWNRRGYGRSAFTGQDLGGDHDDSLYRLSLRFDPTPDFTSTTKVEHIYLDQNGLFTVLRDLPAGSPAAFEAGAEICSATPMAACATSGGIFGLGLAALTRWQTSDLFTNGASLNHMRVKTWHVAHDMSWDITDSLTLRSVTGYHDVRDDQRLDLDGTPYIILGGGETLSGLPDLPRAPYPLLDYHVYTQEFNLSGTSFGRLDWLVGAYGSWEKGREFQVNSAFSALTSGRVNNGQGMELAETDTWALFTQNDLRLSKRLSITFGARYTEEKQHGVSRPFNFNGRGPLGQNWTGLYSCSRPIETTFLASGNNPANCPTFDRRIKASGTSYLFSVNYQVTPETLIYVKTARGFRGGALQVHAPQFEGVSPETATDYELGFKSDFFDRRLRANLAVYHTKYRNKQEDVIFLTPGTGNPATRILNAASAKIDGFEAEVTATPARGWSIYGTLTYVNGRYEKFACAPAERPPFINNGCDTAQVTEAGGEKFPDPNWQYAIGSRLDFEVGPGRAGVQLDWAWVDKQNLAFRTLTPAFPDAVYTENNKARGLLNARVDYTLKDAGVTIALWSTNLLNKKYATIDPVGLYNAPLGIGTQFVQEPRMWGVTLTKLFGDE